MRVVGLGCVAVLCGASAVLADSIAICNQVRNARLRVLACSDVIAGSDYSTNDKAVTKRRVGAAHPC